MNPALDEMGDELPENVFFYRTPGIYRGHQIRENPREFFSSHGAPSLQNDHPPEAGGVADFSRPVMEPEVNGPGRSSGDDDGIEAGKFQLRTPVPAGFGLPEPAR